MKNKPMRLEIFKVNIISILIIFYLMGCSSVPEKNQKTTELSNTRSDTTGVALAADILKKTERFEDAIHEYDKLVNADPTNGRHYYRRGFCKGKLDLLGEAIKDFHQAAVLGYRVDDSYFAVGANYMLLNQDDSSIHYLQKALKANPNLEKARALLKGIRSNSAEPHEIL